MKFACTVFSTNLIGSIENRTEMENHKFLYKNVEISVRLPFSHSINPSIASFARKYHYNKYITYERRVCASAIL